MAPSRNQGKARVHTHPSGNPTERLRGADKSSRRREHGAVDVYQDLLNEAADEAEDTRTERPLKRRRVGRPLDRGQHVASHESPSTAARAGRSTESSGIPLRSNMQTIEQSSDDGTEIDFEDVDLDMSQAGDRTDTDGEVDAKITDVSVLVEQTPTRAKSSRINHRKPMTASEKALRLTIHKAHYLCLVAHCMFVNSWCNNSIVQKHIRPVLSNRSVKWFDGKSESQAARHLTLIEALQKCRDDFLQHFKVTASGIQKARWMDENDSTHAQIDDNPQSLAMLIAAAKKRQGSQDTGNQLFCALLRSIGIEARLICSLQLLPFGNVPNKTREPPKAAKNVIYSATREHGEHERSDSSVRGSTSIGVVPSARRRLGQPTFAPETSSLSKGAGQMKQIRRLSYPVWWVEAFDEAYQKWIAVDPVVTKTINKATKLEPPSTYHDLNQLVYVIAMESNGVAKDVTRRYAKAYNAKTRRSRVESTENGSQWLKRAMKVFRGKGPPRDRDQIEDAEMSQKESREGLPVNVQDFKDHPFYALERHLKRHEVLDSRREVGKINAGTTANPRMEAVFRRSEVLLCRSADKWFRLGRKVRAGEQPLKHISASRFRETMNSETDGDRGRNVQAPTTALYSFAQTVLYVPTPVTRGRVPRNAFGNLDVYVASMVPAGGKHLRHPLTQQAARLLLVDYADAVTGFQFKNRKGIAVIEGAVVPLTYAEAVEAVIDGMEWLREEDSSRLRSLIALQLWKKFFIGLSVRQKVGALDETIADAEVSPGSERGSRPLDTDVPMFTSGTPLPTAGRYTIRELSGRARQARKLQLVTNVDDNELVGVHDGDSTPNVSQEHDAAEVSGIQDLEGGFVVSDSSDVTRHGNRDGTSEDIGGGFLIPADVDDARADDDNDDAVDDDFNDLAVRGATNMVDENHGLNYEARTGQDHLLSLGEYDPGKAANEVGSENEDMEEVNNAKGDADTDPNTPSAAMGVLHVATGRDSKQSLSEYPENNAWMSAQCDDLRRSGNSHPNHALGLQYGRRAKMSSETQLESDDGSLLSHDPDDEDAEPDWLESD